MLRQKAKKFVANLSWRVFFFLNPQDRVVHNETYGFTTEKPPPRIKDLTEFEDRLVDIIRSVKLNNNKRGGSEFQARLKRDLKNIKTESRMFMGAD